MINASFFFLFIASLDLASAENCQLAWVPSSNGQTEPYAVDAFKYVEGSAGTRHYNSYIARSYKDGYTLLGYVNKGVDRAHFTETSDDDETGRNIDRQSNYDMLTNPRNCIIDWIPGEDGSHPPNAFFGGNMAHGEVYVCRSGDGFIIGGRVAGYLMAQHSTTKACITMRKTDEDATHAFATYQVLSVVNLETDISDFEYEFDEDVLKMAEGGRVALAAVRTIKNEGRRPLFQDVEFRKEITQITEASLKFSEGGSKTQGQRVSKTESKTISIKSTVEVGPGETLIVSGYVRVVEDKIIPFKARARVVGQGLDATAIKGTLLRKNFKGRVLATGRNYVDVEVSGHVKATFGVNSFIEAKTPGAQEAKVITPLPGGGDGQESEEDAAAPISGPPSFCQSVRVWCDRND